MAGELSIGVTAELADFKAKMSEMPGIGAKEARDMVRGITRELKLASKAAEATGKDMGESLGKLGGVGEKVAGKLGGVFAEVSDLVNDMLLPMGEAAGGLGRVGAAATAVGGATIAAAAGVALLAAGSKALVDGAIEARDRLVEQGEAAELPPEALESLKRYEAAARDLSTEIDQLSVSAGGMLADDLAVLAKLSADVAEQTHRADLGMDDFILSLTQASPLLASTAGMVHALWDAFKGLEVAEIDAARAQRDWADAGFDQAEWEGQQQAIEDQRKATEQDAAAKRAAADAMRAGAAAARELNAEYEELLITERDQHKADEQRYATMLEQLKTTPKQAAEMAELRKLTTEANEAITAAFNDALESQAKATQGALLDTAESFLSIGDTITGAIVAGYEKRVAAGEKLSEKEKAGAMAAFRTQQGLALVSAEIAAIQTFAGTTASLTAVGVPFPVAIVAGIAAGAAITAGAVAEIATTSPPEFPTGRSPDHETVRVRPDEPILTPRAGRALGKRRIDELNGGVGGGREETQLQVVLQIDREVIGEAVARVRGGSGRGVIRASRGRKALHGGV